MPIEVREIIIRAQVESPGGDAPENTGSNGTAGTASRGGGLGEEELQNIITMCTDEVLSILKRQTER